MTVALDEHAQRTVQYLDNADKLTSEADDYRLRAGRELIAARSRVDAGETSLTWSAWCEQYIRRSARDIRRLMAMAAADDPAQAREAEKARNRAAKPAGSRASSPWRAHDEGAGAFLRGVPQDDCPYIDRRRDAAWRKGWSETERRSGASPVVEMAPEGVWNPLSELRNALTTYWPTLSHADQQQLLDWQIKQMADANSPVAHETMSRNGPRAAARQTTSGE